MSKLTETVNARLPERVLSLESGSGFTPPGPVAAIDFAVGDDAAQVGIEVDPVNNGPSFVGLFPRDSAEASGMTVYGPDGSEGPSTVSLGAYGNSSQVSVAVPPSAPGRVGAGASFIAASEGEGGPKVAWLVVSIENEADPLTQVIQTPGVNITASGIINLGPTQICNHLGSLQILGDGRGIYFTSPDGLTTRKLSIDNSGDPVWT